MALALATPPNTPSRRGRRRRRSRSSSALAEAFGHRSYVLLVFGFFTCGFQLAFITLHLPAYLIDRGLSAQVGGWALATIGLFNIIGSIAVGWLATRYPRRYLLGDQLFPACGVHRGLRAAACEPGEHTVVSPPAWA
jgi:MFS family permease